MTGCKVQSKSCILQVPSHCIFRSSGRSEKGSDGPSTSGLHLCPEDFECRRGSLLKSSAEQILGAYANIPGTLNFKNQRPTHKIVGTCRSTFLPAKASLDLHTELDLELINHGQAQTCIRPMAHMIAPCEQNLQEVHLDYFWLHHFQV